MKKNLMMILAAVATSAILPFSAWAVDPVTIKDADGADISVYEVSSGFYQNGATYDKTTDFYITSKDGLKYFRDWVNGTSAAMNHYYESGFLTLTLDSFSTNNGMPMWQSYVLGLTPNGANATALRLAATAKDATMVTITAAVNVPATLENSGTTVSFRLVEQNADGTWTDIEAGKASPSFDVSLDDVAGKVLTIFADIVTE